MSDTRRRNINWIVCQENENPTMEGAQLAVLMDIREELQSIKRTLQCQSFSNLPYQVTKIRIATERLSRKKPRKKTKKTA